MSTLENPAAVPRAPTEPGGVTVEPSSPAPAAKARGYAPPIIDTLPEEPEAEPVTLPRLWLSFHSDGKKLYCSGALQRAHMQHVTFDAAADPVVAQAYTFFAQLMIAKLDGRTLPPPPAPAAAAATTEQPAQLEQLEPEQDENVPPTNPNPPKPPERTK